MKLKPSRIIYLILFFILISSRGVYAQVNNGEITNSNSTYYQYEQGSNRLEYTLTALTDVMYYLYDRNGNITRKVSSKNFPLFVSSELSGWETFKMGDNNLSTVWASKANSNENAVEWAAVDLGSPHMIGGISLTPRSTLAFPKDFKIQSSNDAITWTDIPDQSYSNYVNNGSVQTFNFGSSVLSRYIRIYVTKLGTDDMGGHYFMLAEFHVNLSTVATSSSLKGWEAVKLVDNNGGTTWSSAGHGTESNTEWVEVDLENVKMVGGVSLSPRATLSFPKDFTIQSSNDAVTWTDIPDQSYRNYMNNGSVQTFNFGSSVITRYIRVYATRLGADDGGSYYFQLAEFKVNLSTVATSSSLAGWGAVKLVDNNAGTTWSSTGHGNEFNTEWVALDLESVKIVRGVSLSPRATLGFPKDFKFQFSNDAVTWKDIPNQTYNNYVNNGSMQTFNFESSVTARYIRIYATKLGTDDLGGHYFQLNEFKANLCSNFI